jgi:hypothetical protein
MRRYWLERNRKCIGFRWTGHKPNKEDVFVHPDNRTPVERVSMTNGKDLEELWYPWDFLHMRRMFRNRITEHGEPIFAEADGIYKKLRIALDQMVVHRAQVQPDRYAINIDVQDQPPIEQMKTVQRWRQQLRSKLAFGQPGDPSGVGAPTDFTSYYNALALDTIIYLAQPKGFNNTITKLQGTAQVPDVYDIELLTDLFYSIIGDAALLVRREDRRQRRGPSAVRQGPARAGHALPAEDQIHSPPHHPVVRMARLFSRGAQGQEHRAVGHQMQDARDRLPRRPDEDGDASDASRGHGHSGGRDGQIRAAQGSLGRDDLQALHAPAGRRGERVHHRPPRADG